MASATSVIGEKPAIIGDLLRLRGLDEAAAEEFLKPDYGQLADPFLMSDMDKAVARIAQAISKHEKIAIYGDYDIDGIVSTALMVEVCEMHGLETVAYIPSRYEEGYGLNIDALSELKQQKVGLIISVDCGITSVKEAEWAQENGVDLIITDHHEVPDQLPDALAVINPRRPGDQYPFKELAGVGVAFMLARALQSRTNIPEPGHEKWLLDLVAMGTICDVMPLVGENRTLARYGLLVLAKTRRVGLVALAQSAGIDLSEAKTYHMGFVFGPRLNAAGRLENAGLSLDLLRTSDPLKAQEMAFKLEELNSRRQIEQARIASEAEAQAEGFATDPVLVLADPGWPHGIVGIVASKLAEKFQKPVLVAQVLEDQVKGSGRSARGYNLIEGLRSRTDLFSSLGGHQFAAGFTLPLEDLDQLRQSLAEHFQTVADDLPPKPSREAELILDDIDVLNLELYQQIEMFEPFGNGNPQPTFGADGLKVIEVSSVGKNNQHLKLKLASPAGTIYDAIGFNLAEKYPNLKPGQTVEIVFFVEKNRWNGRENLQLVLLSVQ